MNFKKNFKRIVSLLMINIVFICFTGCGTNNNVKAIEETKKITETKKTDLIVFAAASMTETLNEIKPMYEKLHNDVNIVYNFDSSGTLLKQIVAGADVDVFISAAQKQMNQLDVTKDEKDNPDKNDFILDGTRQNLLENKVALAVPDGNPAGIEKFSDITTDKLKLLAIGNSDVPVGSYTLDILKYLGTSAEELEKAQKITYGSNVKEVTTQVKEGAVDAGIIYATDAFSAKLTVVDTATKDMCKQVIYPIAVMKSSKIQDTAKDFIAFLNKEEAMAVFKNVGFSKA